MNSHQHLSDKNMACINMACHGFCMPALFSLGRRKREGGRGERRNGPGLEGDGEGQTEGREE